MPKQDLLAGRFKIVKQSSTIGKRSYFECLDRLVKASTRVIAAPFEGLSYEEQRRLVDHEFEIIKKLNSSNALAVYERVDSGTDAFLTFVKEGSIQSLERQIAKAPFPLLARIVETLCEIVNGLHENQKFLNVLFPEQLAVSHGGIIKMIDFSFCTSKSAGRIVHSLSDTAFFAPEFLSTAKSGISVDMYALGMMAAHIFSGYKPQKEELQGNNRDRLVERLLYHIRKRYDNPEWLEVIRRSLSSVINDRPANVEEFYKGIFPKKTKVMGRKGDSFSGSKFSKNMMESGKISKSTIGQLQKAYKQREYHLAAALSDDAIDTLVSKGKRDQRVEAGLILARMFAAGGLWSRFENILRALKNVTLKASELELFKYYEVLHEYMRGETARAATGLKDIKNDTAQVSNLSAMIFQRLKKLDGAFSSYQEAVRLAQKEGDKRYAAICTGNLAYLLQVQGKYQEAIEAYDQAIKALLKLPDKEPLANIYFNKAGLLTFVGDFDGAESLVNSSQKIALRSGLRRQQALNYLLISEMLKFSGDYTAMEEVAGQALAIFTELKDSYRSYKAMIQLGWCSLRRSGSDHTKDILGRIRMILDLDGRIDDTEYRLLYVCFLRKYLPQATLHMQDLMETVSPDLRANLPLYYEWKKLYSYVLSDAGLEDDAKAALQESKTVLHNIISAIPSGYQKDFLKFMEEERIRERTKFSKRTGDQRRVDMEITNRLPWIYDSMTQALKGIVEKLPSGMQQRNIMMQLQKMLKADAVLSLRLERSVLVPTGVAGELDEKELIKKLEPRLSKLTSWKSFDETIGGRSVKLIVAPTVTGREWTGCLVAVLSDGKKEEISSFGEILQSYADLIEVIELTTINEKTFDMADMPLAEAKELSDRFLFVFGDSPSMEGVKRQLAQAVKSNVPLIIYGGDGAGKKTLAEHVHFLSAPDRRLEIVDCRQSEEDVLYQELFGTADKPGAVERAHGGTLLLLHIERLDWEMQNHLVYLLQEGGFKPYGSKVYKKSRVRLIGTAYEKLWDAVDTGRLNAQLIKNLGVLKLHIPLLSQRLDDIGALVGEYLTARGLSFKVKSQFVDELKLRAWSFNTAELFRVIDNATALAKSDVLTPELVQQRSVAAVSYEAVPAITSAATLAEMLRESEKKIIESVLEKYGYDKELACRALGISKPNLYKKMRDFNLAIDRVTKEQLVAVVKACGGNKQRAAQQLGISRKTLYNKIAEYHLKI